MKKQITILNCVLALLSFNAVSAAEVLVNTQEGEAFIFEIDPNESLCALQEKVTSLIGKESDLLIELSADGKLKNHGLNVARTQGTYLGHPRNYFVEVSPEEKNDIRYIVTTLANKSLIAIAIAKGDIEEAGDRIDHLHPLRFLMTIFTDEELKAGVRNIRSRGWIWNHFVGGLKESLSAETAHHNMTDEQLAHFTEVVKISPRLIIPSVKKHNWDEFIDLLITHIPRSGDHDRYDT